MWETLERWFAGSFMPHGHCYLWSPSMVWLQVLSNLFIGIAYVSISASLTTIVRRIRDIPFSWMYLAFGVFIITCGLTHFLDVVTIWSPVYWLDGGVRAITAAASVGTALLLFPLVPKAVSLAHAAQGAHERGVALESTYKELATAHQKARELDRLKTELFANVSHELRTPLALVLGPATRLRGAANLTAEQRADVEVIGRNARTLLRHVDDLLEVARLEAEKTTVEYARADLARVARFVAGHFGSLAEERETKLTLQLPDALDAEVDPDKLERVLLNLLSNAFKYTPSGGTVRLSLERVGDDARIEVADSGPGIPEDMRERVFERFARLEGTTHIAGTGLGLAIARDLVALHEGTLTVGEAPEGGALFTVSIPRRAPDGARVRRDAGVQRVEAAAQAVEELRGASASGTLPPPPDDGRPLVLVVEDNPEMNAFVAGALTTESRVVQAFDGEEGAARARALRPDLVVSDVTMPRKGGEELVAELRADPSLEGTPVLLLTARTDEDLRARMLRRGAQDYLTKPFAVEELRARAGNLVAMKRARDVLQDALATRTEDVAALAAELAGQKRELETAMESIRVAREQAEHASRSKSSFLGLVSHELRTPLTSLQLLVDRLAEAEPALAPRHAQTVQRMSAATARLTELVDSLLQTARIRSGALSAEIERVDLGELVARAVEELRPQAQRKDLHLAALRETDATVRTDPKLLRLVVVNLVANAVKFTERGSVVASVAAAPKGGAVVRVRDTGPGIAPQEQARIFEPFHQSEPTRHKHVPGVGLDLSLVRGIVESLGGHVRVESEVGEGSTFEILLPASAPSAPST